MSSISDRAIAAVCTRGHVLTAHANPAVESTRRCGQCGAKIICACPECQAPVLGDWRDLDVVVIPGAPFKPDDFCFHCDSPYPWASRQAIVYHIENQLDEQADLPHGDRRALLEQLQALTEPPVSDEVNRRQVGALDALKKLAPKAWQAALPAVQSILTAEAKRQLGMPPT